MPLGGNIFVTIVNIGSIMDTEGKNVARELAFFKFNSEIFFFHIRPMEIIFFLDKFFFYLC
jgi:hypothetical protein